jgi:hypothetical protein
MVTMDQIMNGLEVVVAVMLIVLLYHALFIAVDLRKILKRVDDVTEQIESVIMKPMSMAVHILQWVLDHIEQDQGKGKKKSHGVKVVDV